MHRVRSQVEPGTFSGWRSLDCSCSRPDYGGSPPPPRGSPRHGEREWTRFTARDFIASGAIRYIQFDGTRYAGFTEALRVAALAEQHGVMVAPHTAPELHGHLLAALPRCAFAVESHGDAARDPLPHHLFIGRPETRDSHVYLNDKPGFGVEINWDYAKKHRA